MEKEGEGKEESPAKRAGADRNPKKKKEEGERNEMDSKIRGQLMIASSTSPFLLWPEPRSRLTKQDFCRSFQVVRKSSKPEKKELRK